MERNLGSKRTDLFGKLSAFFKDVWAKDWFDPHSSFLRLRSFWVPFLVIIVVFIALCWRVVVDNNLKVGVHDWSVHQMYDWFKYPLWVLALLIPVIGLFNANHKSEQARAQMELTRSQNNFANYYKHIEEFKKYMEVFVDSKVIKLSEIDRDKFHRLLFPNAREGDYKVSSGTLETYYSAMELLAEMCLDVLDGKIYEEDFCDNVNSNRALLESMLHQGKIFKVDSRPKINEKRPTQITISAPLPVKDCLYAFLNELNALNQVFSFETSFHKDQSIRKIVSFIETTLKNITVNDAGNVVVSISNNDIIYRLRESLKFSIFVLQKQVANLKSR